MAYTTIDNPELYFQVKTYVGNNTARSITLDGSENMQPDWVWFKNRSSTQNHRLFDSVRGAGKNLVSNNNGAEINAGTGTGGQLRTFDSNGFSIGDDNSVNKNSENIVAWNWKAGTSFTNDASSTGVGSIDSAGSVSTDAGFSIVSWTGTGSAGTIKHGLSTVPKMIIVKNRNAGELWLVYHKSLGATKFLRLAGTEAEQTLSTTFNDTEPTSSVFSVGSNEASNRNGYNMIAYCFAEKQGYSKFGSYTGNGNADGTFVYTGFLPSFVMVKQTNASGEDWFICDTKREGYNAENNRLMPNLSSAESTDSPIDILSNSFKARQSGAAVNGSGASYIYMAFAENPFVTSSGVPACAR